MPRFTPQWLVAPAAVAVVAAVWFVRPEPGAAGSDAAAHTDPEMEAANSELQARQDTVTARIAYKEQLIDKLIAGRATLPEVAGEFLYLNQNTRTLTMIRNLYSGSDDEERSARNVLDYVRQRMLPAEQNARVFERLHREFEQAYGHPRAVAD
jgi:hypothetical protein